MRDQQALLNRERSAGTRLVDACPTLQYKGPWEELERTDKEVIFARLYGVYTLRSKDQGEESISERYWIWNMRELKEIVVNWSKI